MNPSYISELLPLKSETVVFENIEYDFRILHCMPKEGKFQLLVTDGLRKMTQDVNEENSAYAHLELYICLADYWNLEKKNWPVHWLNRIAQVPQKNDTWFGLGDSIPAGNPPTEVDDDFKANHFILFEPSHIDAFKKGNMATSFNFLAVVPLFEKEIKYKLRNSHSMLRKKFDQKNVDERLDIYRPNVCKKSFFGRK